MALASAPRPEQPYKINFGYDEIVSARAADLYDRNYVVDKLKRRDPDSPHLAFPDALHVILALYQNKPLSMKFIAMKRVLADDLELKELP